MITNSVICCETREEAREIALRKGRGYLVTMVNLYHDTMPKSQDAITWPSAPLSLRDVAAGDEEALLDGLIEGGYMLVRHARRGVASRSRAGATSAWTSSCSACRSRACTTRRCSPASSSSATR